MRRTSATSFPALCEITVDCRLLPETTPADVEPLDSRGARQRQLRAGVPRGRRRHALPARRRRSGTRSSGSRPRSSRARGWHRSPARASPTATSCAQAFGTIAYGFFPMKTMDTELADDAHPLGERADSGRRPRARRRHAALGRAVAPRRMTDAADALVVFGITGDLARRSTLPALYSSRSKGCSRAR